VTVETPVTDDNPIPTPDPELYPAPAAIALKNELPVFATSAEAAAGTRADVVMSPVDVVDWFNAKLPGTPALALLGNNSWGLPDLSTYTGRLAGDGSSVTDVTGIGLNSLFGNQFYDIGTGIWISTATLQAPGMNGIHGASFYDNFGTWLFSNGIQASWFSGDGSSLSNLTAFQLTSLFGYSIYDSGGGSWQVNGNLNANSFFGSFSGDGSNLSNLTAFQLTSPTGIQFTTPAREAGRSTGTFMQTPFTALSMATGRTCPASSHSS